MNWRSPWISGNNILFLRNLLQNPMPCGENFTDAGKARRFGTGIRLDESFPRETISQGDYVPERPVPREKT